MEAQKETLTCLSAQAVNAAFVMSTTNSASQDISSSACSRVHCYLPQCSLPRLAGRRRPLAGLKL